MSASVTTLGSSCSSQDHIVHQQQHRCIGGRRWVIEGLAKITPKATSRMDCCCYHQLILLFANGRTYVIYDIKEGENRGHT
ncbi:hypothetical protein PoB_003785900, partial [Plakobranchus ocellatus]